MAGDVSEADSLHSPMRTKRERFDKGRNAEGERIAMAVRGRFVTEPSDTHPAPEDDAPIEHQPIPTVLIKEVRNMRVYSRNITMIVRPLVDPVDTDR